MKPHPKPKHKRVKPRPKSISHLDNIRQLPCLLSGRPAEAAHIRYADAKHDKPEMGLGRKDDRWVVPLCPELHRLVNGCQHDSAEREWWAQFGIDPVAIAKELWDRPRIVMERIIITRQPWSPSVIARVRELLRGADNDTKRPANPRRAASPRKPQPGDSA